ncbi:hypothetical protein GC194_01775 [bacterium]|nr:hypothetical protein [bacterium]
MWQNKLALLLVLLGMCQFASAQSDDAEVIQEIIEYLLETSEAELDFTDLQQDLMGRLEKPINLNKTDFDELKSLGFLTEPEILAILSHRAKYGDFLGVFELQSVEGLTPERAQLLSHFVTCTEYLDDEKTTLKKVLNGGNGEFMMRYRTIFQDQAGYQKDSMGNSAYEGSQFQLYSRASYKYKNKLSIGYTAEKDMGEAFFTGSQKQGFDFYSAHAFLKNVGMIKRLAIGDYQVQFGQGLTMWSGLAFSKTADALNVVKRPRKIVPFRSVNEYQFLRGAALTIGKGPLEVTAFVSHKKEDGNLSSDTLDQQTSYFTSIQMSGFHRTASEVQNKDKITENILGGSAELKIKTIRVGINTINYHFDPPYQKNAKPYQVNDFFGSNLNNSSIYYQGLIKKAYLFGETALANFKTNSLSSINGLIVPLTNKIDLAAIYRYYAPSYNSFYTAPFRELSRPKDEMGLYTGFNIKFREDLIMKLYLDRFKFPWLKYQTDLPSNGYEFLSELQYQPSRSFNMYGRIKTQVRNQNMPGNTSPLNVLAPLNYTHYRFQFRYKISRDFTATSRAEISTYKVDNKQKSQGMLLFQDLAFKPLEQPYSVLMRYAVFNVDDYTARIYTYENDVLYAYSIPAYQGKGYRFYILGRFTIKRNIDLWIKYSQTTYFNQNTVGSGNEQILGNTRSEIKMQARIRF